MNQKRKRLLLVKPILPFPPDQGTKVVSYDLIRTLSREYDVTVLARIVDREQAAMARELAKVCAGVVTVFPSNRKSIVHRVAFKLWYTLVSAVRRRSLKSLYDCPGTFVRRARKLASEPFDLVILEYWQLYPMLDVFPREKIVLLTHDVDMLVNRQSALLERRLFRKIGKVRRWILEQREETEAYRRVDRVLTLTERDAKAVRAIAKTGARVDVLPVGFDVESYAAGGVGAGENEVRDPHEVLFMGALHAAFNLDSLEHFVFKIYPHLDDDPDIRITVVGGSLPKHLAFFGARDNVNVVGRVDDVRPYLSRAACLVIPLRFGGGLRIRILEAMLAGLPIVCSSVAIAGMDFEPEAEFLLGDEPTVFASQVKRLLADPRLARGIANRARTAAIERYGANVQSEKALRLVGKIINKE